MLQKFVFLIAVCGSIGLPALASAAAPVSAFPLQELAAGRNEVNLPFTRALTQKLAAGGNDVTAHETVIAFMAQNRIRTVGYMETFHIARVREELGAAFVLLGTVTQKKERPQPSMGLILHLVRTSDARIVWSYIGHVSAGDERRPLGIGEPKTVADLEPLLLNDVLSRWPWEIVNEVQKAGVISIDTTVLQPAQARPGTEVYSRVKLRNAWLPGRAPRVFFKADEQLHAAQVSGDGHTYEATWIAGEKDGRYPVTLILEWPLYGRSETALIGSYLVDGLAPLFEIELRGVQPYEGDLVFRDELVIIPRLLVRKPLDRWRLAFVDAAGQVVGADEGTGNLPERFVWQGRTGLGGTASDGVYEVVLQAWDKAGNTAKSSRQVTMNRSVPSIELALARNGQAMTVDLEEQAGKVPLAYWRMEMWTREGKLLTQSEGTELPAKIGVELSDSGPEAEIQGILVLEDILGNRTRAKVEDLLPKIDPKGAAKGEEPKAKSEKWVDEF